MGKEYRNNHYVPQWYQNRFLLPGNTGGNFYYLDLQPGFIYNPIGKFHQLEGMKVQGVRKCFVEKDIYTTRFGNEFSTLIEKVFFGDIDSKGRNAVEYFTNFTHPSVPTGDVFHHMMLYMSTQKLRTPKGLRWLASLAKADDRDEVLKLMMHYRQLFSAIWTECVWQIADASNSETKLIVSDHPITVYNRRCGPRSHWCRESNDPDIRLHGTHTIFPLDLNKVLILTNLSWARNPYQSPTGVRPNPKLFRDAIMNFTEIQTKRFLTEQEVREINFIIKSRAFKFISSQKEEWLYPERHISKSDWNNFGNGLLLMPDPRAVKAGGETVFGYKDGRTESYDAYGRPGNDKEFGLENRSNSEFDSLYRFKAEFARMVGPTRRGRSFNFGDFDPEIDSEELHKVHLNYGQTKKKNYGKGKV